MIRVIIVDDEPFARRGVRNLLEKESGIEIVAESETGELAIEAIRKHRPDLVVLDIQMPGGTGFDVLNAMPAAEMPVVVFVTAHDRHALEAFEAHAIDYLLKPVDPDRFIVALERARAAVLYKERDLWAQRLAGLLQDMREPPRYRARLMIRGTGRVYLVRVAEVDWIEAAGNYARLHVGRDVHLIRETLTNLENELDPEMFCRIHRSTIVNLDRIKEILPDGRGDQLLILRDGTRLDLSARHREAVEGRLGRPR
jgi:two-component system LytT family response regulator